jgi:hypothetical protein
LSFATAARASVKPRAVISIEWGVISLPPLPPPPPPPPPPPRFMEDLHPPDCPCCRVAIDRRGPSKRTRADADLSTFLPEEEEAAVPEPEGGGALEGQEEELEGQEEELEGEEEPAEEDALIHDALFKSFETHVERLDAARLRRIEALSFKSALEDDGKDEVNEDATQDDIDGLGVWLAGDEFQGDVNYRTLQKLLTRVDQRGFERSAQQLEARSPLRLARQCLADTRACCVCSFTWPS